MSNTTQWSSSVTLYHIFGFKSLHGIDCHRLIKLYIYTYPYELLLPLIISAYNLVEIKI